MRGMATAWQNRLSREAGIAHDDLSFGGVNGEARSVEIIKYNHHYVIITDITASRRRDIRENVRERHLLRTINAYFAHPETGERKQMRRAARAARVNGSRRKRNLLRLSK